MKNSRSRPPAQRTGAQTRLGPRPTPVPGPGTALSQSSAMLLEHLKDQQQPMTISALTTATGLHPNTVRERLDALEKQGLAARHKAPAQGRGRPAWLYSAIAEAPSSPQAEYAGLAATLAQVIDETSPHPRHDAVDAGTRWGRRLAREHGRPRQRGRAAARRRVLSLLDQIGFAPEPSRSGGPVRLTRCPLLEAAHQHPDVVCGVHLGIVRGALGEYGADSAGTDLAPFAEPGACLLSLGPA